MTFLLVLLFLASIGKKAGAEVGGGRADGSRALPPAPTPLPKRARDLACSLLADGVPEAALLPLVLRGAWPAVSWPAAEEWSSEDLAGMPAEDVGLYRTTKRALEQELKSAPFLAGCTHVRTPYASGRIKRSRSEYVAAWQYDDRVRGERGDTFTTPSLDLARKALLMGAWYFGAPATEADRFQEAYASESGARMSVWVMPGGGYRLRILDGIGEDETSETVQVATLEEARARAETL